MKRKFFTGSQAETLGPRTVRVLASTGAVDRTGEQVVTSGIDLSGFLANPVILWQHDPEHPIGTASNIIKTADGLRMDVEFAPEGVSKKADEICGLVKSGVLRGVSVGFDPVDSEPMVAGNWKGPQRYLAVDLLEVSIVSIPANSDAAVVQRRFVPGLRRDGKRLSATTEAALQEAVAHLDDAMTHHKNAMALLEKAHDFLEALLEGCEVEEKAKALSQQERQAAAQTLRRAVDFWAYPEHMRGESRYHYAARATFDFRKSLGLLH